MPEVNNIPPSLSYRPADPAEPVLDISIGDALRAATSTWRTRTALIDGTSEEQTRRRWTFEELLTESEKVAQALLLRFVSGEHVAIWAANGPQWVMIELGAALAGLTLVTVNPAYLGEEQVRRPISADRIQQDSEVRSSRTLPRRGRSPDALGMNAGQSAGDNYAAIAPARKSDVLQVLHLDVSDHIFDMGV